MTAIFEKIGDGDITIDATNSPTLADDVLELPTPPAQEITLADTLDATAINETNSPTLADDVLELPQLPDQEITLALDLDDLGDELRFPKAGGSEQHLFGFPRALRSRSDRAPRS